MLDSILAALLSRKAWREAALLAADLLPDRSLARLKLTPEARKALAAEPLWSWRIIALGREETHMSLEGGCGCGVCAPERELAAWLESEGRSSARLRAQP